MLADRSYMDATKNTGADLSTTPGLGVTASGAVPGASADPGPCGAVTGSFAVSGAVFAPNEIRRCGRSRSLSASSATAFPSSPARSSTTLVTQRPRPGSSPISGTQPLNGDYVTLFSDPYEYVGQGIERQV